MTRQEQLAEDRAEAMAYLLLTARRDLDVLTQTKDGLRPLYDFVATLTGRGRGLRQFVVEVASAVEISTPAVANQRFASKMRALAKAGPYPFPALFFAFSMRDDRGYTAWVSEPGVDGELVLHTRPAFHPLDPAALDEIVKSVDTWYDRRYNSVLRATAV